MSTLSVRNLLTEVKESTRRISELVSAIKSYAQMYRASVQQTVVSEELESTPVVHCHRIPPGVTVVRDYAGNTPPIEAIPAEFNQVWTNQSDPTSRGRAFEPFFTTEAVGRSTGLGLEISRRIVVGRHGGEISIDLPPGETVLRASLPRFTTEAQRA